MALKSCPFCGGYARLERRSKTVVNGERAFNTYVRCTVCDARGARFLLQDFPCSSEAHKAATKAWEGRANNEPVQDRT